MGLKTIASVESGEGIERNLQEQLVVVIVVDGGIR